MKTQKIVELLNANIVNISSESTITTGYCGDFLSHVMGKAPSGCCWFTVIGNINVAGVAALAEVALVVLCEGAKADEALRTKARETGINIVETDLDVFAAVLKVFG